MSSDREDSPDWLHYFQAPTKSLVTLSSGSDSPPEDDPIGEDEKESDQIVAESSVHKTSKAKTPKKKPNTKTTALKSRKGKNHSESEDYNPESEDEKGDDQIVIVSSIHKTSKVKTPKKKSNTKSAPVKNTKGNNASKREGTKGDGKLSKRKTSDEPIKPQDPELSLWTLSSDSESCPRTSPPREDNVFHKELPTQEADQNPMEVMDKDAVPIDMAGEFSLKGVAKLKSPRKWLKIDDQGPKKAKRITEMERENDGDRNVAEEETTEKKTGPYVLNFNVQRFLHIDLDWWIIFAIKNLQVSSSRLPLVLAVKVQRSKTLVECEGESIDLSGDLGSVGRVVISDTTPSGNQDLFLDLKGTIYKTTILPSRTFCIVNFGQSEAKIEAIMNDFIRLKPQSNVYEAETMVEGTLEGFSFDSEDEADNLPMPTTHQTDDNESGEQQTTGKGKSKADKTSGLARKKAKAAAKKPSKKVVKRKSQVPKKTSTKK